MIRKFTFNKSIWLYIFLLISSFKITNAKDLNSFRTNVGYMGIVNGNPSTMVLSVPELNDNTAVKNAYTISNKITPLDPVLRACVSTTPVTVGSTMSATVTGNNTASGYTTQFVLLDATNKIVAGPQATASFAATVSGIFKIVAVNYSGSVMGLTVGQNISSISGTCWEISAPKCFDVQVASCTSPIQIVLGNALTASISGNNTTSGFITEYVLTDENDVIVQGPSSTSSFAPTTVGAYKIYAVNYSGTITGLTVGNNFLTGVLGNCMAKSAPKCFTVICPIVTNIASNNTNPTSCGASDGSIKICGLPANSTGWTVTYNENSVVASALTGQTTDANGCITISGLSAGSYSNIKVSSAGCIGTNSLNVNLSDSSSPSPPSGLNAISNSLCIGSNTALSATGVSGASYVWSVSPSGASLVSNSGVVNGTTVGNTLNTVTAGTYTVSVTQMISGCISPAATTTVVVNGLSTAPSIVGGGNLSNICPLTTVDLTTKQPVTASGQTYEWHTVSSNPSLSTMVLNPSAATTGTYYLYSKSTIGGCYSQSSSPVTITITSCLCTTSQSVVLGSAVTATITGNNTTSGYTTQYVLTDANDVIVQGPSPTASFTPTVTGSYKVYAINYSGAVTGLTVGTNFLSGVTGSCVAKSAPKCFTVICPTVTNIASNNTNPTSCGASDGSIKICGLPANSTGWTLTYEKNTVAASALTGQTTDANGCITISGLSAGFYSKIKVSSAGCTGTNLLDINFSDPVTPSLPTVANASPNSICSGNSTTLSATCATGTLTWFTDAGLTGTPLASNIVSPTSTTTYYASCVTGSCKSSAASVVVTVTNSPSLPTVANASPNSICSGNSTTLSATCATGTLTWFTDAGLTGTPLASNLVIPTSTTTYYASCVTGLCKSSAASVVVTVNPVVTLTNTNFTKTNPTTCNGTEGTIKICGLVANTSYSVSYNKNGASQIPATFMSDGTGCITITTLMAGTYDNFNVTNTATTCSSGVLLSVSLILSNPPSATITLGTSQNPSACGLNDGFIQLNGLTAGTAYTVNYMQNGMSQTPLSFTASGSSYVLGGLTAANYTNITVTSGSCISNPLSKSLSDPITTTITLGAKTNPTTCSGNEGTFTVSGLVPNTAYVLNYSKDGFVQTPIAFTSTSTSYVVSGLLSGSYSNIRVISAGCTSNSVSTTLTDPAAAVISLGTPNNPSTCGGTDGSLTINGLEPGTVYTIKYKKDGVWQTPITYSATTTSYTIEGLRAGAYSNISVSNNSCNSNTLSQMLVDPLPPTIGLGTLTQPNSCGANNGAVIITGLTTGLQYTLNYLKDGVQQTPIPFTATGTTYTINALEAGNYTGINVKQNTCVSNTLNVSLSNPGGAIIDVLGINPTSCSPGNDGKIVLSGLAQGLNYILNYSKNGVAQTQIPIAASSTSYVINGLTAAAYTNITVTQANCVSNVVSVTLVSPKLSAAIVASINPICSGTSTTLEATCATGTVKWYTDVNLTSQLTDATVSPSATTTYYASCEVNGCKSTAIPVEVKVNNCISSLKIVKSQTAISGQTVGSKITYSLVVTNTGNTTLTNIVVTDANATLSGINPIASLAPNATATLSAEHVLTQADLNAGKVINVANVSGKSPNGSTVSAVSDAGTDTNGKPITNPELVDGPDADTDPTNDPTETTLCPAPVVSVNGGVSSVIICSGGTATLSVTGCSGTITWTSNSGDIVPVNGIVSPKVTTTYKATCTNGLCVSSASNSVTVILGPCANPDGIIPTVAGTKSIISILANDKNSDGTQADLAKITVPVVTTDPSKGTTIVNPDGTISYTPNPGASGTDTFIYTICDKVNPSVCDTAKVTILINAVLDVKLQLKVFLQGAFFSPSGATDALMRDDLRSLGVIPTVEPYTGMANSRFTKVSDNGGQQIGAGVLSTTGSDAIVDWVFVELRDAANPSTILKTRAALVQRDGDVVEASDGTTPVTFIGAVGTSYYVSIKHRNHLGAMTATPITMSATGTTVDFTSMTAAQLWDKGLVLADGTLGSYDGSEQVTLGNGKMGLWAGNARNADNKVKYSGTSPDPAVILSQVITFSGNTAQSYNYDFVTPVYLVSDINMDGKVKYQGSSTDTAFILFNIINKYPNNLTNKAYNFDFMVEQIP